MAKQQVVGVAIGIIQNGQIVYLNGYGLADKQQQVPVGPKTLFRWASISKVLTALAAMHLAENQKLDIDADVRTHVPEFPTKNAVITPRQLLCHQSGIPHYTNGKIVRTVAHYEAEHPFQDVVRALDTFKESPLLFKPGEKFSYSTYGYILLSAVVQRAARQEFASHIQQTIAAPLGMTTLRPDYQWEQLKDRAVGYTRKGPSVVTAPDTDVSWKLGGGGYVSNIEDLARLCKGLIQRRLLSRRTYSSMWQPQQTTSGALTAWGLGFNVERGAANGRLKVAHNGRQEKASCRMVLYPDEGHGIVVMSNCDYVEPAAFSTAVYAALSASR
jgi:CubicO group peptidase (beta-lactamase class C family)